MYKHNVVHIHDGNVTLSSGVSRLVKLSGPNDSREFEIPSINSQPKESMKIVLEILSITMSLKLSSLPGHRPI